jgi:hypothetical protein
VLIRDKIGTTAFFCFSTQTKDLNQLRIYGSANSITADIITGSLLPHPIVQLEAEYLMSDEFQAMMGRLEIGDYALV